MNINEVLEIIKKHIDFVNKKRLEGPITGWDSDEWAAFWDGHIRCAIALMNQINVKSNETGNDD